MGLDDLNEIEVGNHARGVALHDGDVERAGRMATLVFGDGADVDINRARGAFEQFLRLSGTDVLIAHDTLSPFEFDNVHFAELDYYHKVTHLFRHSQAHRLRRKTILNAWHRAGVLLLTAVLGACSVQVGGQDEGDGADDSAAQADSTVADSLSKPLEAVPVEVALAHTGEISAHLLFNSTIETEAAVEIYPQISGLVKQLNVEEGDRVEVGDTLLSIEDKQLRIAVEEAQANYQYQQTGFKRTEAMFERSLISDQEFETNKYNFEQARLRLERARLELEYAEVLAPFSGVITERYVQVGARVGPSSKLYDLIKLDDLIARVFAPGQYLTTLGNGQQALITSDFLPDKQFQAWVKRISPVVDPRSGTFKVTVGLRDRWEYLRPGLFVNVRIVTDTHTDAVLIPKQAIVYDGGDRFVFAVVDTMAARIKLQPGFEDTDFIESLAGIDSGTPIIVVGQNGLKDRTRVRIVNSADDTGQG